MRSRPLRRTLARAVLVGVVLATAIAADPLSVSPTASRAEILWWFDSVPNSHVVMAAPHTWQYSFVASDGRALEALSVALVRDGYEIVMLEGGATPTLLMARVELHSPLTLWQRNQELRQTARRHGAGYAGVALKD